MNILQIKRLDMNSIILDYSFWVKIGYTFLDLFIGSKRMIVCSESSIVRSDVYLFVEDTPIRLQWSIPALFQYVFVETFTAKFRFIGGDVIAEQHVFLHRHNTSVHLNSSLNRPGSLSSCCLCFIQHVLGKKIATASAVKLSTQSFDRNLCHSALISGLIQSSRSFSARASYSESVSFSSSLNLFTSQNLVKKL